MSLDKERTDAEHEVVINGSAAEVKVRPYFQREWEKEWWIVEWQIKHSPYEYVQGSVVFDSALLEQAFGLSNDSHDLGDEVLKLHGGTSAFPARFIRYGNYLNIPGPGSGHDGDPNVSIELTPVVQETIRRMLNASGGS